MRADALREGALRDKLEGDGAFEVEGFELFVSRMAS